MDDDNTILVERCGHVSIITINRPRDRNCISATEAIGIGDALQAADEDRDIRAIVITGAGDKAFCGGADLKAIARGESVVPEGHREQWGFAGIASHPISTPVIAAVNGFALGGGTEIALACDIAIADETAGFGLPEVRRGIIAAGGGAFRLADQLPSKIAMQLLLTGEAISAERALAIGLVNEVVPAGQALRRAMEVAELIAGNAPLAVQATKRIARRITEGRCIPEEEIWKQSRAERNKVWQSEDAAEGARAFVEKRAPQWSGS